MNICIWNVFLNKIIQQPSRSKTKQNKTIHHHLSRTRICTQDHRMMNPVRNPIPEKKTNPSAIRYGEAAKRQRHGLENAEIATASRSRWMWTCVPRQEATGRFARFARKAGQGMREPRHGQVRPKQKSKDAFATYTLLHAFSNGAKRGSISVQLQESTQMLTCGEEKRCTSCKRS
jgi:hypothetical protein